MAFLMREGKMASNVLDSMLANAKAEKDIKDGSLIVLGDIVTDTVYADQEYDTYKGDYPAAVTDEVVIADYAGISHGDIAGNTYRVGNKLYDLTIKAGEIFRVRRLALHDKFWLGADNFVGSPVVGQYAIATAGSGDHTVQASIAESGYCVKIIASKGLTAGMQDAGMIYLCEVVKL